MSRFPGDISELLLDIDELRRSRGADLARIRQDVGRLRQSLVRTLDRFADDRERMVNGLSRAKVALHADLTQHSHDRTQSVQQLRQRFRDEAAARAGTMRSQLAEFRQSLSESVSAVKEQTQFAKSRRFRTGAFKEAVVALAGTAGSAPRAPQPVPAQSTGTSEQKSSVEGQGTRARRRGSTFLSSANT